MGLLIIALLCCNTMNSQVKYEIKTKKCLNEIHSEKSHSGSFCHIVKNKTKQNLVIFYRRRERHIIRCQTSKKETISKIWRLLFFYD